MGNKNDKIQKAEFEQKLRESSTSNQGTAPRDRYDDTQDRGSHTKRTTEDSDSIPIIEERIKVDKNLVETGKVRVGKRIQEEEVTLDIPTIHEEVDVERVKINEYVDDAPPAVRHEGDKMIIPVMKEVSVVVKKLLLVEEIHVTKRKVETHNEQKVTLKKEVLDVDRVSNNNIRTSPGNVNPGDRR